MSANGSNKEIKELFVSNLKGTSLNENYLLIMLPLLLQCCHSFWVLNFFQLGWGDYKGKYGINIITVVLPFILSITVLSEYLLSVCFFLFVLAVLGAINSVALSRATKYVTKLRTTTHIPNHGSQKEGLLLISQVRGCVLVSAAICILAVDMKIFPRRWAKTERNGTGVMDLGVGTFALLMGLLWPRSVSRGRFLQQFIVLLALGSVRLVTVKLLNYNEHVSEYGRHWNFFYTLAVVKLIGALLTPLSNTLSRASITLIVIGAFQYFILVTCGYENICAKNDVNRDSSLVIANKEGIISLCGYIILWLVGRLFSLFIKRGRAWCSFLIVWAIVAHMLLYSQDWSVSRRSANMPYIIWTSGCVCVSLALMFLVDVVLNWLEDRANYLNKGDCPDVYSLINRRGLLHFLLANVLTGLVNMTLDTLDLTPLNSVLILSVYTAVPILCIRLLDLFSRDNGCKDE